MGQITNATAKGDPMDVISVAGFNTFEDAFKHVLNGYNPMVAPIPIFVDKNLAIGSTQGYNEDLFVVFSLPNATDTETTLLSITRCHGDVSHLFILSYGYQMLLARKN